MWSGCQGFLDNQFWQQFSFFEDIAYMQADILFGSAKEICHLCLREPHCIVVYFNFEPYALVGLIEDYLGVCGLYLAIISGAHRCVRSYVLRCLLSAELKRN